MRHGKPVILTIRTGKMAEDGILFYLSENNVWLTDFVDAKYISK
jgi:putative RNA 2'-phosphotransferase